jgi:carbamoylphosphate synthase large subunit
MTTYSTADTVICSENQIETSPFANSADNETTSIKRPGGKIVQNYRKVAEALTKTVSSFELSRQIYG